MLVEEEAKEREVSLGSWAPPTASPWLTAVATPSLHLSELCPAPIRRWVLGGSGQERGGVPAASTSTRPSFFLGIFPFPGALTLSGFVGPLIASDCLGYPSAREFAPLPFSSFHSSILTSLHGPVVFWTCRARWSASVAEPSFSPLGFVAFGLPACLGAPGVAGQQGEVRSGGRHGPPWASALSCSGGPPRTHPPRPSLPPLACPTGVLTDRAQPAGLQYPAG